MRTPLMLRIRAGPVGHPSARIKGSRYEDDAISAARYNIAREDYERSMTITTEAKQLKRAQVRIPQPFNFYLFKIK